MTIRRPARVLKTRPQKRVTNRETRQDRRRSDGGELRRKKSFYILHKDGRKIAFVLRRHGALIKCVLAGARTRGAATEDGSARSSFRLLHLTYGCTDGKPIHITRTCAHTQNAQYVVTHPPRMCRPLLPQLLAR